MSALSTDPDDDAEMFDLAPVSLWIEDYSAVRALFEQWRAEGVDDIEAFLATNPDRVRQCSERIRILKINRKTFDEIGAPCEDAGENENGHVLVKQVGNHGKDEVTVIFQHWIKSRTLDAQIADRRAQS